MKWIIPMLAISLSLQQCKSTKTAAEAVNTTPATEVKELPKGKSLSASTMTATIGREPWVATGVKLEQLGDRFVVRGADDEGRVLSIMLPPAVTAQSYTMEEGNGVVMTWSVSRKEGFVYQAPYKGIEPGVVTIQSWSEKSVAGTFNATVSNGGRNQLIENGSFVIAR